MEPFDRELTGELVGRAKRQLRARMRALRSAYPAQALGARSARIVERVRELPAYRRARAVGLFWPLLERGEVDVRALDESARADGKRVYYPFIEDEAGVRRTGLALTENVLELADRGLGFAEPPRSAGRAERGDIDFLVVPALAVAASGHRLGYGIGFYDATLPDFRPPASAVVVAFDFQLLAELPVLAHDVACDLVVTDSRTLVVEQA